MLLRKGIRLIALVGALLAASPAVAQELRIGLATEPASLDPLLRTVGPDEQVARHFYDSLILQGERQQLIPGLAVSWRPSAKPCGNSVCARACDSVMARSSPPR